MAALTLKGEKMTYLFNFVIAVLAWVGVFKIDLVKPLIYEPLGPILASLTAVDYLLFIVTFIVVTAGMEIFDRVTEMKKRRSVG
jgi:hypothetical protein